MLYNYSWFTRLWFQWYHELFSHQFEKHWSWLCYENSWTKKNRLNFNYNLIWWYETTTSLRRIFVVSSHVCLSILRCECERTWKFASKYYSIWSISSLNCDYSNLNERIFDKIKRIVSFTRNEFKSESFVLKKLISIFNLIMNCSSDSTHNEYYNFVRRLCFIFYFKIFITRTIDEFIATFQLFSFSSDWNRIQSLIVHMRSWSMSKCARAFVIIWMFFRCWLQFHHVRQTYKNDLEIQILKKIS